MKNIIAAVVVVVCIVIGGIGGSFLKSSSGGSSGKAEHAKEKSHDAKEEKGGHGAEAPAKDSHGKKDSKKDSHGKKDAHGSSSSSGVEYFKFSREFVVPVMRESRVTSLVILNINLEIDAGGSDKLHSMEPKIRDNIMTTLIELSNDGSTLESIATLENYESIRATVLLNLQTILPDGIRNVLIVDMAKQNL